MPERSTGMEHAGWVLVVDDDPEIRNNLTGFLQSQGFPVLPAPDGATAQALLRQNQRPGVILLDLVLPDTNGLQLLPALRQQAPGAPVVAMSLSLGQLAEARAAGVEATLVKPFDPDEVLAIVARWLAQ